MSVACAPSQRDLATLDKLQTALNATREAWRLTIEAYTDLSKNHKKRLHRGHRESHSQAEARSHVRRVASKAEECFKELHFAHFVLAEQIKALEDARLPPFFPDDEPAESTEAPPAKRAAVERCPVEEALEVLKAIDETTLPHNNSDQAAQL